MRLEEATAVLRPRRSWEAVDLGCALARRHWGRMMRGWLMVAVPCWVMVFALLWDYPLWTSAVLWWMKPVLTRQPVYYLSRVLFGSEPRRGDFWKDRRTSLWRGLVATLTWLRFSPERSFRLPVAMLEGLRGGQYRTRANALGFHGGGSAIALTYVAAKLELAASIGLLLFVNSFLVESPIDEALETALEGSTAFGELPVWALQMGNLCYVAAVALMEPFYAASGFALYINSRTHLEGWDIEVAFRRMSARLRGLGGAVVAVVMAMFLMGSEGVRAQETEGVVRYREVPAEGAGEDMEEIERMVEDMVEAGEIREDEVVEGSEADGDGMRPAGERVAEILKGPEFAREVRRQRVKEVDLDRMRSRGGGDWVAGFGWIGYVIIAVAVVALVILLSMGRFAVAGPMRREEKVEGPRVVMGMEVTPESLPADVAGEARRLWEAGEGKEAMRLLYRGALMWMVSEAKLPVVASDTEGDCVRHVRGTGDAGVIGYFERLSGAWTGAAYADVLPREEVAARLFGEWPFGVVRSGVKRQVVPGLAALVVVGLVVLVGGCNRGEEKYEDVTLGYKAEARFQPWLAASKLLEESYAVEVRSAAGAIPEEMTMLVIPLGGASSVGEARSMLRWARKGNHLVILGTATDRFRNDWLSSAVSAPGTNEPFLKELGVVIRETELKDMDTECVIMGEKYHVTTADRMVADVTGMGADVVAGDEEAAVLASVRRGSGRVTLVTSGRPWRNRWIGDLDHAGLLEAVAGLQPVTQVIFVNSGRVTFWQLLWQYGWMPVSALGVLMVLWLWRHLTRFGPVVPRETGALRRMAAQLGDQGSFLWMRLPDHGALVESMRHRVLRAAGARGLSEDAEGMHAALAERSGLPEDRVARAMGGGGLEKPEEFRVVVADLQVILAACGGRF